MILTVERRYLEDIADLDIRLVEPAAQGQARTLIGYAAVFGKPSVDLGGFTEVVAPGAFKRSLASGVDIRALVDHDPSRILGRTSNGTLRLAEDHKGLRAEVDLPNTTYANDLAESVRRGDIRGMSFAFGKRPPGEQWDRSGPQVRRTLTDVNLIETTFTSIPAYPDTEAALRSIDPDVVAKAQSLLERPRYKECRRMYLYTLAGGRCEDCQWGAREVRKEVPVGSIGRLWANEPTSELLLTTAVGRVAAESAYYINTDMKGSHHVASDQAEE